MAMKGWSGLLMTLILVTHQHHYVNAKSGNRRGRRCETSNELLESMRTVEGVREEIAVLHTSLATLASSMASLTSLVTATLPEDCSVALNRGSWLPLQTIIPPGLTPRQVRCNHDVEGGGWTVILSRHPHPASPARQHLPSSPAHSSSRYPRNSPAHSPRYPPSSPAYVHPETRLSFNRTWEEYKNGFGDLDGEFWIGNEVLHALTSQVPLQLRVELTNWEGTTVTATWDHFRIGSESDDYKLSVGSYQSSSTAMNDLQRHDQRPFSTHDHDNDRYDHDHCARQYGGGWWYFSCYDAHLTGSALGAGQEGHHGIVWRSWTGYKGLRNASMMVRPHPRPVTTCTRP
ncbi:hypothetical protein Pmani_020359 [Petrolisthes manimaculis]|uniref:Fibrinogen C-terminal domain-containing protein n=1 Tax=Petrolisthes manimaculis TaxID=1843537 RepID=A0AAE1U4I3_9EUCA|nr:hypothetical protein Pmani_020359 [Petrolisthes manimaculis]